MTPDFLRQLVNETTLFALAPFLTLCAGAMLLLLADIVPGTRGRTSASAKIIDLVDAHARACHNAQTFALLNNCRCDLCAAAHNQCIIIRDNFEQLGRR